MTKASFSEFQQQGIDALKQQQDAYLNAVRAWKKTAGEQPFPAEAAPSFPTAEAMPSFEDLPTPAELFEANQLFMKRVFEEQQRFLASLNDILGN